ncbi:MAG: HD domain-containing protein [Gemmatimonadaceae bacterium]|nr:HD domain-containing protein [Gemmatimonadaceae bacterium]
MSPPEGDSRDGLLRDLRRQLRDRGASTGARLGFWESRMEELSRAHKAGAGGLETAAGIAATADAVVLDAWESGAGPHQEVRHALAALGGYGRGEMAPHSDVDLLFLFGRKRDKKAELVAGVLHPLWDLGFDIGHSSRTLSECVEMSRDLESCTAMLDARLLAGDAELFADFRKRLLGRLPKGTAGRLRRLHLERGAHTGSVQLLEPNVKESPGGLREIHLLEWAVKARERTADAAEGLGRYLDEQDLRALAKGRDFLWRIRHELHFSMGRKHDVLGNEIKPVVARSLGYFDRAVGAEGELPRQGDLLRVGTPDRTGADHGRELAVEAFLRDYYLHASQAFHAARLGFDRLAAGPRKGKRLLLEPGVVAVDNQIELPGGAEWLADDPLRLLSIFRLSQTRRLYLSEPVCRLLRQSTHLIDDEVRRHPGARDLFLRILERRRNTAATLRAMHDLGVLGAYLPEFGDLTCLVQYDIYHLYTVDEHTLVGLEKLEELLRGEGPPSLVQAASEIERKELLFLGMLLHDIGKSRREEHISVGLRMGAELCERIGLSETDARQVLFLIENHQEMVAISKRRDLDDHRMIADFAGRFAEPDWLRALYLMSYADLSAVASDAWTDWQGALLWELYHKTMEQLASGMESLEERARARAIVEGHLEGVRGRWAPEKVEAFEAHVASLSERYLVAYDRKQIERHLALVEARASGGERVLLEYVEHPDHTEVVVCAGDQRHLLAEICGVLAVHDINILRADVQTREDDVVIDTFQVTDVDGTAALPPWKKQRLERRLSQVIAGELAVQELFDRYSANWSRRRDRPVRDPEVLFENQVSDRYTVVDVNAQDAVGLLYTITHCLGEQGCHIHMAIINTVTDRATDAFYIVDAEGGKIVNFDVLESLRLQLLERLAPR